MYVDHSLGKNMYGPRTDARYPCAFSMFRKQHIWEAIYKWYLWTTKNKMARPHSCPYVWSLPLDWLGHNFMSSWPCFSCKNFASISFLFSVELIQNWFSSLIWPSHWYNQKIFYFIWKSTRADWQVTQKRIPSLKVTILALLSTKSHYLFTTSPS